MQKNQPIAVIGGTGKSGKYLTRQLLSRGQAFKLLVRDAQKLTFHDPVINQVINQVINPLIDPVINPLINPLIELVEGDARDYTAVHSLIRGCKAVISCLGQPKGEAPIFSAATTNILRAMRDHSVKRYILITGLNVDTPWDKKGARTSAATEWMKANYAATTADKQQEYALLAESNTDWTLVRLPLIELTENESKMAVSLEDCPGEKISSTDLANFLIAQLSEKEFGRKSPFLANT